MKITIDEKACKKHKMSLAEVLIALAVRNTDAFIEIPNMLSREILVKDTREDWYMITQHWSDVLDEILAESSTVTDDNRLLELAKKIQGIFPSGYKTDERSGAKYYHKSNSKAIQNALKRFIAYYEDYSDEDILDAAKRYVNSFRGNYSRIEMANYFVFKDNRTKGGEITSSLATFLENKDSREKEVGGTNSSDWMMSVKN